MSKKFLTNAKYFSLISVNREADTVEIENGRIGKVGPGKDILPISKRNSISPTTSGLSFIPGFGDRCNPSYARQSVLSSGADLIFGSDAPVEFPNPFFGLYASIARNKLIAATYKRINRSRIYEQCISLQEAVTAYSCTPTSYHW